MSCASDSSDSGSGTGESSSSSLRSSSRGAEVSSSHMKVVLPDNSELELPHGATGLDAARAIGPKLAEQAVVVRANGNLQHLRPPRENGQQIQLFTTRDSQHPYAAYAPRHPPSPRL